MNQNHLGKYLKLSSINSPIIEYQLFNFAKESIKHIFLTSKCGEIINGKEFKDKPSNSDLLGTKNVYPLCCLYKKAKPKIKSENGIFSWKDKHIKKKIDILSNAYMTLCILTLADYYNKIIKNEKKRKEVVKFYLSSSKCQLNYYLKHFRNELGLFVNKKYNEGSNGEVYFTQNSNNEDFDFAAQAYLMICFRKCSNMLKEESPYKLPFLNFSTEMEKMFYDFKKDLLKQPSHKIIDTLSALQMYSKLHSNNNVEILNLIFEIIDNLFKTTSMSSLNTYYKLQLYNSLLSIKSHTFENIQDNYLETTKEISEYLWDLQDIFSQPNFEVNEINSAYDLLSYQIYICSVDSQKALNFYNTVLIPSKVFSCFPNLPKKHESERYFNFEHKEQYKIPDSFFKPFSYKTISEVNLTPIIAKDIHYSFEKNKFTTSKYKFNSLINTNLCFLILTSFKNQIIKTVV